MPEFTVKFWLGSLDREACKARAHTAGLHLVMEDTPYLYFRVEADSIRQAETLVYDGTEPRRTDEETD